MERKRQRAVVSVLIMVSLAHLLNDLLQSVIPSIYPMLKKQYGLSFVQIGAITLILNLTSSILQPLVGYFSDKRPKPYGLAAGMGFTLAGVLLLAFSGNFVLILFAVALTGCGSAVLHPEASKVARMAAGRKKGMAQSVFQVGGNVGRAFGPLVVALLIAPAGQRNISWLSVFAGLAIFVLLRIGRWYKNELQTSGNSLSSKFDMENVTHLSRRQITWALVVLLVLMFSKDFYITNLQSYLTFYLIDKFGLSIQSSQLILFAFLLSSASGLLIGGAVGDRFGRKYVIWDSILGAAPFALLLPYVNLFWTIVLSIVIGLIISSAMSAILVYATDMLPGNVGMISGAFYGLSFGLGGIGSALFGWLADATSIQYVFQLTAFLPLLGIVTYWLPKDK
ncbi:MAG: MFS transporter [Prevotella sp.]|nr:MFS transporter [Prevotella sp.]